MTVCVSLVIQWLIVLSLLLLVPGSKLMFEEGLKTKFSDNYRICWKEPFDPITFCSFDFLNGHQRDGNYLYPLALFPPVGTSWLSRRMLVDLSVCSCKLTRGTESITCKHNCHQKRLSGWSYCCHKRLLPTSFLHCLAF